MADETNTLPPLLEECEDCDGEGWVQNHEWKQWWDELAGSGVLACYSTGGRWSPNEDRPMHATTDGERSLCGVEEVEVHEDPEPVPFREMSHQCLRCESSYRNRVREAHAPDELLEEPEEVPCIECEGHGKRPTEDGLRVMELVRVCRNPYPERRR